MFYLYLEYLTFIYPGTPRCNKKFDLQENKKATALICWPVTLTVQETNHEGNKRWQIIFRACLKDINMN